MADMILHLMGEQLRSLREERGLTQPALAVRLGRDRARISEIERDLINGRWGRDRLTLFAEMCEVFGVVPLLVPRARAAEIRDLIGSQAKAPHARRPVASAFDENFVDLGREESWPD